MNPELRNYMYHHYDKGYMSYPFYGPHIGYGHPSNYPYYHPHFVPHYHPHIHLANYIGTLKFAVPIQAPVP